MRGLFAHEGINAYIRISGIVLLVLHGVFLRLESAEAMPTTHRVSQHKCSNAPWAAFRVRRVGHRFGTLRLKVSREESGVFPQSLSFLGVPRGS
jgi:hypothetical protein